MLCSVSRSTKYHSLFFNFCFQFSENISLWSHLCCIPTAEITGIHLESIMMLSNRNNKFCACFLKKLSPFLRIELLCFELRNKIFISEFIQSSVFFFVMQIFFGAFYVHISGIPLISECRNTVNTPVDKNSEFISCIPLRYRMLTERIPGIRVRSLCDHLIDQRKVFFFFHFVALFYIFWSFSTDAYMLPLNFLVVYI